MNEYFEIYDWTGLSILFASHAYAIPGEHSVGFADRDKYQLGIKMNGRTDILYDNERYDYWGGTLLYLPKESRGNILYDRKVIEEGKGVYIFFDSVKPLPPHPILRKMNDSEKIYTCFCKVANLWSVKGGASVECMAALYKLLATIRDDTTPAERADRSTTKLAAAEEYISGHFRDEYIDIAILSSISGMTPDYFRHRFQKAYGLPPLQYMMRLKLEEAKRLLSSGKSVNETARLTGFNDANYFSRFFRDRTGVSPTEFVKKRLC